MLHEFGLAAPKDVQTPLAPAAETEQALLNPNAEHNFEFAGWLTLVVQKLRFGAPKFSTEQ